MPKLLSKEQGDLKFNIIYNIYLDYGKGGHIWEMILCLVTQEGKYSLKSFVYFYISVSRSGRLYLSSFFLYIFLGQLNFLFFLILFFLSNSSNNNSEHKGNYPIWCNSSKVMYMLIFQQFIFNYIEINLLCMFLQSMVDYFIFADGRTIFRHHCSP